MSIPEFKPLPYTSVAELKAAFDAGEKFLLASPHIAAPEPVLRVVGYHSCVCAHGRTQQWDFKPDGLSRNDEFGCYQLLLAVESEPTAAQINETARKALFRSVTFIDGITDSDRAGIQPAVDLSYFNPPPIKPKRIGHGLLTVWQPRKGL